MINTKIKEIRKKIDIIDSDLLLIIKKRANLVDKVIKLKKNKKEIIDKIRINFILKKLGKGLFN